MRSKHDIQTDIKRLVSKAWWAGAALGSLLGFVLGYVVGLGSAETVMIILLGRGVDA